ncbi:ankyrin unc44 [Grosmannia clavigera kw1407]|uniref:Ankyrin unc44 n=1 Tax=Grosmannia clavigera (strain kw1407 / UAMH 11150) TaxID=655863 RepID=F0XRD3_GROCL|nr:ankyrin unc44 [Grosmannia clavigera kw1407]EFW99908.1 ankyrin unc44 [Grosmannia clavigera kw1407]
MASEVDDCSARLLIAARTGRLSQARHLLNENADPSFHTGNGWTPLHAASWNGHPEIVKLLIQHHASLEIKYKTRTPLQKAAERGYLEIVRILIDGGANVEAGATDGFTPLFIAADKGFGAVVTLLLDHNANVNASTAYGWTSLHRASYSGRPPVVEILVQRGANINASTVDGWTSLHSASYYGKLPVVRILVQSGADTEALFRGSRTPLHKAAEAGHAEIVQVLLEGKADINARANDCQTSLHLAATEGHVAVVRLLLERGIAVDTRTVLGATPLHIAANSGKKAIVEMLLQKNPPLEAELDKSHFTALHQAAEGGFADIVDLLLNHGADIEARSVDSSTPLHLAASKGHAKVVKLLLERHAKQTAKNKALKKPLALAEDNHHTQVITLLSATDQQDDSESSSMGSMPDIHSRTNDASFLAGEKYNDLIKSAVVKANKTASPVKIAVIDTGCSTKADYFNICPRESKRIMGNHWRDFAGSESSPIDEDISKHGTMVSVLLLRVAKNAEIFVARIAKTESELESAAGNIEKAIQHAQDPKGWNVDIICMSFGFRKEVASIKKAIRKANFDNNSIVFFAAAANQGSNEPEMFPASLSEVISVRGTDHYGTFVGAYNPPPVSTNSGLPLFGTLGQDVPTFASSGSSNGCSVATPIMAGMVAMVMQWIAEKSADKRALQLLRTPDGVHVFLKKAASVDKGNNRRYVHVWDLFANGGENCVKKVESAMSELSARQTAQ